MLDNPYMIEREERWQAPEALLEPLLCPYATEQERVFRLCPRGRMAWLRAIAPLRHSTACRCLLLGRTADDALTTADLAVWAAEAQTLLPCVVGLVEEGETYPCGHQPRCRERPQTAVRESEERMAMLGLRGTTLSEALSDAFPQLSLRNRTVLQAWAHQASPKNHQHAIENTELGEMFGLDRRSILRILASARDGNPQLFRRLEALRTHRLYENKGYEVRSD
ncbi:MAG: hypothetical protein RR133_04095 [Kiritimatiellia bacterium]